MWHQTVGAKAISEADVEMVNRRQNEDELRTQDWLEQQGFKDIKRTSNDPPDFILNGDCAVEVTRLSQRIVVGKNELSIGAEQSTMPLTEHIERVLIGLGSPANEGKSWVVDCEYDFREYLPEKEIITNQISEVLAPLLNSYDDSVVHRMQSRHLDYDKHASEISVLRFPHLCLDCGICLELAEFSYNPESFLLQSVSDGKGFNLAGELQKSVKHRISEKSDKILKQDKVEKYKDWWLILVDHVCHVPIQILSEREFTFVLGQKFGFWSRVVIVSSRNPIWHFNLLPQ